MKAFRFDGKNIPFEDGDTLGSALWRRGIKTLSRSMKYHRPRGLHCNTGSCARCFVDVDGVPNVPACKQFAEAGLNVTSQNRVGSAKRDLLAAVDLAYPEGFEPHQAFTRPRILNRFFVRTVRFMSGWGKAPRIGVAPSDKPRRHTRHVNHLIIGGGHHGLAAAKASAGPEANVLLVDDGRRLGGSARWNPADADAMTLAQAAPIWDGVELWSDALAFGIYGDTVGVRRGMDLWEFTADRITIAPGKHDGVALFPGNDRPGILTLRGAERLLHGQGVLPGKRIIVHGSPLPPTFAEALSQRGASIVATGSIQDAAGAPVRKARLDGTWHACDVIICNTPGVPRVELFQQAGCKLHVQNGLRPVADAHGETSRPGMFAAFGGST